VLLGLVREATSDAARLLRAHGMTLDAARAAFVELARQGRVPASQPGDRELLGILGIDLDAIRRQTEQAFGAQLVAEATWRVTRRRGPWAERVVWTPLCGPPLLAKRALHLASQRAGALGHPEVRPEHVLLGVLDDAQQPAERVRSSRRHRQITTHVGLPDGYHGAAGALLEALAIDPELLRATTLAALRGNGP
jgi:hypothetical protein